MSICILVIPFLFGEPDVMLAVPECPSVLPNVYDYESINGEDETVYLKGYIELERTEGVFFKHVIKEKMLVYDGKAYRVFDI